MNAEYVQGEEVVLRGPNGPLTVRIIGKGDDAQFFFENVVLTLHQFQVFGSLYVAYVNASSTEARATVGVGDGANPTAGGADATPSADGEREEHN